MMSASFLTMVIAQMGPSEGRSEKVDRIAFLARRSRLGSTLRPLVSTRFHTWIMRRASVGRRADARRPMTHLSLAMNDEVTFTRGDRSPPSAYFTRVPHRTKLGRQLATLVGLPPCGRSAAQ